MFNNVFIVTLLLVTLAHYSAKKKKKNHKFVIRPLRSKNFLVAELVE